MLGLVDSIFHKFESQVSKIESQNKKESEITNESINNLKSIIGV